MQIRVDQPSMMNDTGIHYLDGRYYEIHDENGRMQMPDGSLTWHPPSTWQSAPVR